VIKNADYVIDMGPGGGTQGGQIVAVGTPEEIAKLDASYEHLCKMRDELVTLNIVPAIEEWNKINPNL
jgi:hypothetical protein